MSEEVIEEIVQEVNPMNIIDRQQFLKVCLPSHSEEFGAMALALAKAQSQMNNGSKDKQGYGYKYMTLGNLMDIVRPAFSENGIAVIQSHLLIKDGDKSSVVTFTELFHESGQWHKSAIEVPIKIMTQLSPAQCEGIAATYGRRYGLQAVSLVCSEEDQDAAPRI